jgi:hypothetical protein
LVIGSKTEDEMADIEDALRSDEAPGEPSPRLVASVMEVVRLEKDAPRPASHRRLVWATGALSLLALLGLLSLSILTRGTGGPVEILAGTDSGRVAVWREWVVTSGARLLLATVALVAVILLVRRAERSV